MQSSSPSIEAIVSPMQSGHISAAHGTYNHTQVKMCYIFLDYSWIKHFTRWEGQVICVVYPSISIGGHRCFRQISIIVRIFKFPVFMCRKAEKKNHLYTQNCRTWAISQSTIMRSAKSATYVELIGTLSESYISCITAVYR